MVAGGGMPSFSATRIHSHTPYLRCRVLRGVAGCCKGVVGGAGRCGVVQGVRRFVAQAVGAYLALVQQLL